MTNKKLKILIVEDEFLIAMDTKFTLEALGYEVTAMHSNFHDTIREVEQTRPDLLLMDINIKGEINGIETAKYLKELYNIPSLFISAYDDELTMDKISHLQPIGLLNKPFDDLVFQEIMINYLCFNSDGE